MFWKKERTPKQGCFDAYAAVRDAVKQFLSPVPSDGWSGSGNLPVFHWTGTMEQGRADCPGRNSGIAAGRHSMLFSGMDEKSLYAGEEKCEEAFFQRTAYSWVLERLGQLDQTDRNKQCELIRTSMELIPENKEHFVNQIYEVRADEEFERTVNKESLDRVITMLSDRLCSYALWNQRRAR